MHYDNTSLLFEFHLIHEKHLQETDLSKHFQIQDHYPYMYLLPFDDKKLIDVNSLHLLFYDILLQEHYNNQSRINQSRIIRTYNIMNISLFLGIP